MGVDFILFPLGSAFDIRYSFIFLTKNKFLFSDTLKTRLQSKQGFLGSGGFRGVYSGLASTALGSAPTSALFFTTYEASKVKLAKYSDNQTLCQIASANLGEIVIYFGRCNRIDSNCFFTE